MSHALSSDVAAVVSRTRFMTAPFDTASGELLRLFAADRTKPFRYVVTPNVDHVVRVARDPGLRQAYDAAWLSICDSRPILELARLLGVRLSYLPGSDLTDVMFRTVMAPGSKVAMLAPSEEIARKVEAKFPIFQFIWLAPPGGVGSNPEAMQACVDFVAACKADYIFIAIGSPTSERIAYAAAQDGRSEGLALCVGAALEFLVGARRRAPRWMRAAGIEWLYRLCSEPRRLWRRYVLDVLPLAYLFVVELRSRRAQLRAPGFGS